jgi:hypothetical protein
VISCSALPLNTPGRKGRGTQKPTQTKEVSYFAKVFPKQIQEFSNTERAKYEPQVYFEKRATNWTRSMFLKDAEKLTGGERQGQIETRMIISNDIEPILASCVPRL